MNKGKLAVIAALLGATIFGVAYAKSFEVTLSEPTAAGSAQMPAGDYRLEFKDSTATLTSAATGKGYKLPVTITTAEKSFKATSVDSDESVKPAQLRSIQLGGSKIKLEFGK